MRDKGLVNVILIVICIFSVTQFNASARSQTRIDPIVIMGTEPIEADSRNIYRINREKKLAERNAKKATEKEKRLLNEQRYRTAYKEIAKVFIKLKGLDSYCDRLILHEFKSYLGVSKSPEIFKEKDPDETLNPVKSLKILNRCMHQSGEWKISTMGSNRAKDHLLHSEHLWTTNRSRINYRPASKRLEITPISSYQNNFATITEFVFGEENQLERLNRSFASSEVDIGRFAYQVNALLSDDQEIVLESISTLNSGKIAQNRITISKKQAKILKIETFLNAQLLSRIKFEKVRFNPTLVSTDLTENIPTVLYAKTKVFGFFSESPFLATVVLMILVMVTSFPFGILFANKRQTIKEFETTNKRLLSLFFKLFGLVILVNLIFAALIYIGVGTGGHPPAIMYPFVFILFGVLTLLVIGAAVIGIRLGLFQSIRGSDA